MALCQTHPDGREDQAKPDPGDLVAWKPDPKLQNQTICALAVALLCAFILALLVIDFRLEVPFTTSATSPVESSSGSFPPAASGQAERGFQTWLFVCSSFVCGMLVLTAAIIRADNKR